MQKIVELYATIHPDDLVRLRFELKPHPKGLTRSSPLFERSTAYLQKLCKVANTYLQKLIIDSPGFEVVRGKLPRLTIDQVCAVYKQLYSLLDVSETYFIHFDVPAPYHAPPEVRKRLLEQNYANYAKMVERLGKNFPLLYVVHGWTEDELRMCIEMYLSSKRVTTPSYLGETKVRAGRAGPNGLVSIEKKVALGSYMMLKNPILPADETANLLQYYIKTVPKKTVWERLAVAMNVLRSYDFEVFVLGGSSPNTCHLIFLSGAKAVDGSSWHFAAKLGRIFVPEYGELRPEHVQKNARAYRLMQEYWNRPENILRDLLKLDEFIAFVSEPWRREGKKGLHEGYVAYLLRATWNLYVLHIEEEEIANEYACDFDRYAKYLERRFEGRAQLKNILKLLLRTLRKPYVQTKIDLYLGIDSDVVSELSKQSGKPS